MGRREELLSRRDDYRKTFREGVSAEAVLLDLASFCHAYKTTHVSGDTHGSAQLEGRRQVWLRIQGYVRLTEDDFAEIADNAKETADV